MKNEFFLVLIFTILMSACSSDNENSFLLFKANYRSWSLYNNGLTRAAENSYSTSFKSGDKIGLYVINGVGSVTTANLCLTYDGSTWNYPIGTNPLYYNTSKTPSSKFFIYYPYQQVLTNGPVLGSSTSASTAETFFSSAITNWNIPKDLSTHDKYTAADLMVGMGNLGTVLQNNAYYIISFTMYHQMSMLELNYPFLSSTSSAYNLTLSTGETPLHVSNGTYRLLVRPNISINITGSYCKSTSTANKYTFSTTFTSPSAGKYYTVTIDGGSAIP